MESPIWVVVAFLALGSSGVKMSPVRRPAAMAVATAVSMAAAATAAEVTDRAG